MNSGSGVIQLFSKNEPVNPLIYDLVNFINSGESEVYSAGKRKNPYFQD